MKVSRHFIADALKQSARRCLWYAERAIFYALQRRNFKILRPHGINLLDAIPIDVFEAKSESGEEAFEKLRFFLSTRWPQVQNKYAQLD